MPPHVPSSVRVRLLVPIWLVALLVPFVVSAPAQAQTDATYGAPPATIRVCDADGQLVDTVPFKQYVQTVLPREFPPSGRPSC